MPATKQIEAQDCKILLKNLLGRDITVETGDPVDPSKTPAVLITFHNDEGGLQALWAADLRFAAFSAAALTMVPLPVAEEAVSAGKLPEDLMDCFREVANVGSSLFNHAGPHVVLADSLAVPPVPEGPGKILASPGMQAAFRIEIEDYGKGSLSMFTL